MRGTEHTHVIREAISPATDNPLDVWTMWCGEQCIALEEEPYIIPEGFDFYHEDAAEKATCPGCRAVLYGTGAKTTEGTVPA